MSNFDLARRELANPYENHGKLTDLQKTQLAWEKRVDPMGIKQDIQNRARIYGTDAAQPLAPQPLRRPINYNRRGF